MALGARFAGGFQALAWWGQSFRSDEYDLAAITTPEHGAGVWMGYSEDQLISIINLLDVLFRDIPTLTDIRGHWYVSPGRKVDPNPLFPMEQIRARILGRDDPSDLEAIDQSEPVRPARAVQVSTGGSGLNMRRWPSINPNILASIPNGTILPVIRAGEFGGQRWNLVVFDGREGWVVDAYTKAV